MNWIYDYERGLLVFEVPAMDAETIGDEEVIGQLFDAILAHISTDISDQEIRRSFETALLAYPSKNKQIT